MRACVIPGRAGPGSGSIVAVDPRRPRVESPGRIPPGEPSGRRSGPQATGRASKRRGRPSPPTAVTHDPSSIADVDDGARRPESPSGPRPSARSSTTRSSWKSWKATASPVRRHLRVDNAQSSVVLATGSRRSRTSTSVTVPKWSTRHVVVTVGGRLGLPLERLRDRRLPAGSRRSRRRVPGSGRGRWSSPSERTTSPACATGAASFSMVATSHRVAPVARSSARTLPSAPSTCQATTAIPLVRRRPAGRSRSYPGSRTDPPHRPVARSKAGDRAVPRSCPDDETSGTVAARSRARPDRVVGARRAPSAAARRSSATCPSAASQDRDTRALVGTATIVGVDRRPHRPRPSGVRRSRGATGTSRRPGRATSPRSYDTAITPCCVGGRLPSARPDPRTDQPHFPTRRRRAPCDAPDAGPCAHRRRRRMRHGSPPEPAGDERGDHQRLRPPPVDADAWRCTLRVDTGLGTHRL